MQENLIMPSELSDRSFGELCRQPGTKVTIESKEEKKTVTVKRKENGYSLFAKIETYSDGTKTESLTTSPNMRAISKKQTMATMKKDGKTQQEIADHIGTSQPTVSRTLNG